MKLSLSSLQKERAEWLRGGFALPAFDSEAVRRRTREAPTWIHFGAGNIFRAFPCAALQRLLDAGLYDRGVIAIEAYDPEIITRAYAPFDDLSVLAVLRADGTLDKRVIASVAEALTADDPRVKTIFECPSLQMASFTVTEKAYKADNPMMAQLRRFLRARMLSCGVPLSMVSMDNCAHNGEKLREAILGSCEDAALRAYIEEKIAFPNTMIDKITPHPSAQVAALLRESGFEDAEIIHTEKGTATAALVNAEQAEYLVVEDAFPNGRPPLEQAGVLFCDQETVDKVEKMKVGTCLNPLHTALAVLGCLLGYPTIASEMADPALRRFVEILGYDESLPVVRDPGVVSPRAFLDEVVTLRLPNPFLPDTPQRIATDTSQKIPVRFGGTIRNHLARGTADSLRCVPFAIAAWLRYLMGTDDAGNALIPSPDPRLSEVRARLAGGVTDTLLSDETLFGANLVQAGLSERVKAYFSEMMGGAGAVRAALEKLVR